MDAHWRHLVRQLSPRCVIPWQDGISEQRPACNMGPGVGLCYEYSVEAELRGNLAWYVRVLQTKAEEIIPMKEHNLPP